MKIDITNIEDRTGDFKIIRDHVWCAEIGIRSICVMYDEHSDDMNSKKNIFQLKDNIQYRLFGAVNQYLNFLRELAAAENHLHKLHVKDPSQYNAYPLGNPHYDQIEIELSSTFDGIIFQLSSIFDYISHLSCYICKKNKSQTLYWTKLAKLCRGSDNDFGSKKIRTIVDAIDREFVGKLYDYRSRLLHNARDKHSFTTSVGFSQNTEFDFNIKIVSSQTALKYFKLIKKEVSNEHITLTYLASWLLKTSFSEIEKLLEGLRFEILNNSSYQKNLRNPKVKDDLRLVHVDPKTNIMTPLSEIFWKQYKDRRNACG